MAWVLLISKGLEGLTILVKLPPMNGMGASLHGDNRGHDTYHNDFYATADEISLALEMLACCKSGCTSNKIFSKAVKCYEIHLHALEKTEYADEIGRLANMHPRAVKACSLKIVDLLLFNNSNDPFLSLGLSGNAKADEIHRRWKRLLVLFHPDRPSPGIMNVTRTKVINVAYQNIREFLEHYSVSPSSQSKTHRGRMKTSSEKIMSPVNQALDDVIKLCVKYFWRSIYAVNVLAGSVSSPKRLRRIRDDADYLMFIPSIIVLLTAFAALVMFSLYIVHALFSLVGKIGFG